MSMNESIFIKRTEDDAFILGLEPEKRWEFFERYYELAAKFYDIRDEIVSDDEVAELVKGLKSKPAPVVRKEIPLKKWKFTLDVEDKGVRDGYYSHNHNENAWEDVTIPHAYQHVPENPVKFGVSDFFIYTEEEHPVADIWKGESNAWYKSRMNVGPLGADDVAYLNVDSANYRSDVWVNENPVVMDHVGLFSYKHEITDPLKNLGQGGDPVFAVRVSSMATNMPHMFYNGFQFAYTGAKYTGGRDRNDWLDLVYSGLADDVTVSVMNKNHMENVFIHTESIVGKNANINFDITLRNQTRSCFGGSVEIKISHWSPKEGPVVWHTDSVVESLPMNDTVVNVTTMLQDASLWSPAEPNLYLAHVILKDKDGVAIDDIYETFGVRIFEMKASHFYLNGEKIVLRGFHESSHYHQEPNICPSHEIIAKSLLLQKRLGATCSRWPSDVRMNNKGIAQFCDQYGLMLSWAGFFDIWTLHSDVDMLSSRDAGALVKNLRNHPSIVIWEMGDEAYFHVQEFRRRVYAEKMYDWVLAMDNTRPIIPTGDLSLDLAQYVLEYPDDSLTIDEKRERVLKEYPLFDRELVAWDYHMLPYPDIIDDPHKLAVAYGGYKPAIFTEFGFDSYPNPENVKDIYDRFRWQANPFVNLDKHKQDMRFYGKDIKPEDWRVTQAAHALITGAVIKIVRQYPKEFAGYYPLALFDLYTYYWGSVDALGKAKLPYFIIRNCYDELFLSAFHGEVFVESGEILKLTASNYGCDVENGKLHIIMRDKADQVVYEYQKEDVFVDGNVALTTIAEIVVPKLPEDIYSFEYYLSDEKGEELGKMMELAYLR